MVSQPLSASDLSALDYLVGVAFVYEEFGKQLLYERTDRLLAPFALSSGVRSCLRAIEATTIEDFAQAIFACQNGHHQ